MKTVLVDPVVEIAMTCLTSLLVQCDQKNVGVLRLEYDIAGIPVARVRCLAEQRRDFFPQPSLSNRHFQRIDNRFEPGQRSHIIDG